MLEDLYKIWFSKISLPYKIKRELIDEFENEEKLYQYLIEGKNNKDLDYRIYNLLLKNTNLDECKLDLKKLISIGAKVISCYEGNFPKALNDFDDTPSILYYKGNIKRLNEDREKFASIVGARKNTTYGKLATDEITYILSKRGVCIVSGLARGIDALAHIFALNKGMFTVGIIGCGIDMVYPKENLELFNKLSKEGLIISQFPLGTQPLPFNFPTRNRLIAILGKCLIVVEATNKSGSLITATFAAEVGIDVIVVPSPINSPNAGGVNRLISDGAQIYLGEESFDHLFDINTSKSDMISNKLTTMEKRILLNLNNEPIHIDDLCELVKVDIGRIYNVLFELQTKKLITIIGNAYYVRNYI